MSDVEYSIGLDTSDFDRNSRRIEGGISSGIGKAVPIVAALAVAYKGLEAAVSAVSDGIDAYNVQADAEAKLEQTLKATKNAAGLTADEIKGLASELQTLTKFGDEQIISSSNLLLTFKNIGEDVFPRAQKAILDMSEALGTDLKSSTIQIGKALNDPISGISALSRVGITFTDTQKDMIKAMVESGNEAEAMGIILEELESQFGGVAEASAKTYEGIRKQTSNVLGDFSEKIGEGFTNETMDEFSSLLDSLVRASPEISSLAKSFGSIAGSLISVPLSALTGWVDLFHASRAGTTESMKEGPLKEVSRTGDVSMKRIKEEYASLSGDMFAKGELEQLGLASEEAIFGLFKKAKSNIEGTAREAQKIIDQNQFLTDTYKKLNPELNDYINATKLLREDIITKSLNSGKGKDKDKGDDDKDKKLKPFDAEAELDRIAQIRAEGNQKNAEMLREIAQAEADGNREIALLGLEEQRIADEKALQAQKEADEKALQAQKAFYNNSISIMNSSNNIIQSIHTGFASGLLSSQLSGLSGASSGISNILGTLGLVDPSGTAGIIGGVLGIGSTIASIFEGDSDTDKVETNIEDQPYAQKANIVSSGVDTVIVNANLEVNTSYIGDEQGLDDIFREEWIPRLADTVSGAY